MTARDVPYRHRAERHPEWCDRALCELHGDDVDHRSAPVEMRGVDSLVTMDLRVSDELAFDERKLTNLALQVEDVNCADAVMVYLSLTEVRELRDRLTAQLDRGEAAELADPCYFAGGGG